MTEADQAAGAQTARMWRRARRAPLAIASRGRTAHAVLPQTSHIELDEMRLSGTMPGEMIGAHNNLRRIQLGKQHISGTLPSQARRPRPRRHHARVYPPSRRRACTALASRARSWAFSAIYAKCA